MITKMNNNVMRSGFLISLVTVFILIGSCKDNPLAPFQPEITSATDNFQLQATGVKNRTATLTYDWVNTGTRATVDHSTSTDLGSATLVIKDADGNTVYDDQLVASLNDSTTTGTTGIWEIRLVLRNFSGTLNFRVQKL